MKQPIKLGFVLSQVSVNQLTYEFIHASNKYLRVNDDVDICGFWVNDGPRPIQNTFAMMPLIDCYAWSGHTIATSLHTLSRILSYPGVNRKDRIYYYAYDMDHLRLPGNMRSWDGLQQLIFHPKVDIVVRSEDAFNIIKSTLKTPTAIIDGFDINGFKKLIEETNGKI